MTEEKRRREKEDKRQKDRKQDDLILDMAGPETS
jgi:hypothetical protein